MRYLIIFILFLFACQSKEINSTYILKHPSGIVSDYDEVFSDKQENFLSRKLNRYEKKTKRQIIVVTVKAITPFEKALDFANAIGNAWGVGQKEKDNGVVILLCKPNRQIAIAVGDGAKNSLTEDVCHQVINDIILTAFKQEHYFKGLNNGIDALIEKWE